MWLSIIYYFLIIIIFISIIVFYLLEFIYCNCFCGGLLLWKATSFLWAGARGMWAEPGQVWTWSELQQHSHWRSESLLIDHQNRAEAAAIDQAWSPIDRFTEYEPVPTSCCVKFQLLLWSRNRKYLMFCQYFWSVFWSCEKQLQVIDQLFICWYLFLIYSFTVPVWIGSAWRSWPLRSRPSAWRFRRRIDPICFYISGCKPAMMSAMMSAV